MSVQSVITDNQMVDKINFKDDNNIKISSKRYSSYKSSSFCIASTVIQWLPPTCRMWIKEGPRYFEQETLA